MKITRIITMAIGGLVAFSSTNVASAAEEFKFVDNPTFFIGASAGQSSVDTGISNTTGSAILDEKDTGFKLFGGANLNKYLGIEGFYADLGETSLSGNNGDTFTANGTVFAFTASGSVSIEGTAYGFAPVFGVDITDNIRPFVKVGIQRWDQSVSVNGTNANLSESGTDPYFGIGILVSITDNIGIRAEAERFKFDDDNVDLISAGLQYTF
jgi:OOP family OmpA-OmpF porin